MLDSAADEGILTREQADALYRYLGSRPDTGPSFSFTNILYYFGGLVAIGAMTLENDRGCDEGSTMELTLQSKALPQALTALTCCQDQSNPLADLQQQPQGTLGRAESPGRGSKSNTPCLTWSWRVTA